MGKATQNRMFLENSPIISTLISRFRLHAMHVDVSTINHKFDKRVPSFSFYFLASSQRKFQQRDRERDIEGEGEVIRYATVASDTLSDKEGFSRREEVSRSRLRRWEGRVARKKQRKEESSNSMERYVHSGKSQKAISLLDGLVCHDELQQLWQDELRACVYKKGEKLLGVCAVCLLLIYYAVSLLLRLSDKFEQMLSEDVKNGSTRSLIYKILQIFIRSSSHQNCIRYF